MTLTKKQLEVIRERCEKARTATNRNSNLLDNVLNECIPALLDALDEAERERDVAVEDLKNSRMYESLCDLCKFGSCKGVKHSDEECPSCGHGVDNWQWRGVQKGGEGE